MTAQMPRPWRQDAASNLGLVHRYLMDGLRPNDPKTPEGIVEKLRAWHERFLYYNEVIEYRAVHRGTSPVARMPDPKKDVRALLEMKVLVMRRMTKELKKESGMLLEAAKKFVATFQTLNLAQEAE